MININQLFLRALFSSSWVIVFVQHFYLLQGTSHRFAVLGISNKIQAASYIFLVAFFFLLKGRLKKPSLQITFLIIFSIILLILGSIQNSLGSAFIDFVLIFMQLIFFYIGWIYFEQLENKKVVRNLLNDNILIAFVIGAIFFSSGYEYSSPIIGFFALSVYAAMRFGKDLRVYFWIMLIIMNILWAFGKQTFLISLLGLMFVYFNKDFYKSTLINLRSMGNKALTLVIFSPFIFLSVYIVFFSAIEFGSVKKFVLLIENLSFDIPLDIILKYPELLYEVLDVSTASRLYELLLVIDQSSQSLIHTLFGSGLGGEIDLASKNEFANLQFTFESTRVAQTLPVFMLLKFGILGLVALFLIIFFYFKKRDKSKFFFYPFFICLFTSILAFSTVFKFHFIGFFWGAMIAQWNRKKEIQQ